MAINLGIDNGTTYSTAATVEKSADGKYTPRVCSIQGTHLIDSVALVDGDGNVSFGWDAKAFLEAEDTVTYRGFKMLIGDRNEALRKQERYTDTVTPEKLTGEFLEYVINIINANYNDEDNEIAKLVIGVPASWEQRKETVDCKALLKGLVMNNPHLHIDEVEVISEPTLACAYCADKYKRETGKDYKGKMIIIDYGGGTLDISLCNVQQDGTASNIIEMKTTGAGWNSEGKVGTAGLTYMRTVAKSLLIKNGYTKEDFIATPKFEKFVSDVETFIIRNQGNISETLSSLPNPETAIGTGVLYGGKRIPVTAGVLKDAYDDVIKDVLAEKLEEFAAFCQTQDIDTSVSNKNDEMIKIILVGGFCSFYLTEQQIKQFFYWGKKMDPRFDLFLNSEERENAISLGAALIAEGIIRFDRLMPYHLGIVAKNNGEDIFQYAIKKYEKVVPDKEYVISYPSGKPKRFYGLAIDSFFFNQDDDPDSTIHTWGKSAEKFIEQLQLKDISGKPFSVALSVDKSLIITLHIYIYQDEYHANTIRDAIETRSIQLDEIGNIIGNCFVSPEN